MSQPLVTQLRFARSEFQRCLTDLTAEDAVKRLPPSNSISWIIGHMANQEQYFWVYTGQGKTIVPGLNKVVGFGSPPSTPELADMWDAWSKITLAADPFLDSLTDETINDLPILDGNPSSETYGSMLLRNIYHYWFHTGEAHAIRQQLGHQDLPQFVGDINNVRY